MEYGPYEEITVNSSAAPLVFAGCLKNIRHCSNCSHALRESSSFSTTTGGDGSEDEYEITAEHTSRWVCRCMSDFEMDRELVSELLSRERLVEAFQALVSVSRQHGVSRVIGDPLLLQVMIRYDHLQRVYECVSDVSGIFTAKCTKPSLPPLAVSAYNDDAEIALCAGSLAHWVALVTAYSEELERGCGHRFDDFAINAEWVTCMDDPASVEYPIFVAYRYNPDTPTKCSIRVDGVVASSLQNTLAVMTEVNMLKTWLPQLHFPIRLGLESAHEVRQVGRMEKTTHYRFMLPWPVTNREVYMHGWMAEDLNKNDVWNLCFRSIDPDYPLHPCLTTIEGVKVDKDWTTIYIEGGCTLRPDKSSPTPRCILQLFWNIDLKMKIPQTLLQFVTKHFVRLGIDTMRGVCEAAESGPEWQKIVQNNRWLYSFVDHTLTAWELQQANRDGKGDGKGDGKRDGKGDGVSAGMHRRERRKESALNSSIQSRRHRFVNYFRK